MIGGQFQPLATDEIAELLATGGAQTWKDLARSKLAEVQAQIRSLQAVEQGLTHALGCPSDNVFRCEHFRAELDAVIPVEQRRTKPVLPDRQRHGPR